MTNTKNDNYSKPDILQNNENSHKNSDINTSSRPIFPKRAVITSGMPYGNKSLHFGHVGGLFVHADTFARFLRDRIGRDNVIFVSGTDCYGSPILENYNRLCNEDGYKGSIKDYVLENHNKQKETLEKYNVELDLYAASAFDRAGSIHEEFSKEIFETLYDKGFIIKMNVPGFYDTTADTPLNGRQVKGRCPIIGCKSEHAYADECSLGHQYSPADLIHPISTLSDTKPILKDAVNWYFDLEKYMSSFEDYIIYLKEKTNTRRYQLRAIEEFIKPPALYIQKKYFIDNSDINIDESLPEHDVIDEANKSSVTYLFKNLSDRDEAKKVFDSKQIRYRTGKTLVPFRISGNVEWGIPVPEKDGIENLTFWVWPESLWAPISFTKTYLESKGAPSEEWIKWWFNEDAEVYQFIGEDNIYFYCIAEMALFNALYSNDAQSLTNIKLPNVISNCHLLFMDKKAGSSSLIKPPMAEDLLIYYTAEQLRMHFLSLGLSIKSTSFSPMALLPESQRQGTDTVLKEGNLLTNVFNRLIRSCFYSLQENGSIYPNIDISKDILDETKKVILLYEQHMYHHEFHSVMYVLDEYLRKMNKYWTNTIRTAKENNDTDLFNQVLADCFHVVRTATVLFHPIVPLGCEIVREYLNVDERLWSWDYIFEPLSFFINDMKKHKMKFLEPKVDFFKKHESAFTD